MNPQPAGAPPDPEAPEPEPDRAAWFAGLLQPDRWPFPGAVAETAILTLLLPVLGVLLRPGDPLLVRGEFSWLCLGPVLVALRRGSVHGLVSAGVTGVWIALLAWTRPEAYPAIPVGLCVGMGLLTLLSGERCDGWQRRLGSLSAQAEYQRLRLQKFTRAYHLLDQSHTRIERQLAGSAQSLREILLDVQQHVRAAPHSDQDLGEMILGLFSSYGWIQIAALHRVEGGHIVPTPLSTLGQPPPLAPRDPVVTAALRTGHLSCVQDLAHTVSAEGDGHTGPLCAIPLTDVSGRLWALLRVHQMPFLAFQGEHLNLLAVLGGHLGDLLAARDSGAPQPFQVGVQRGLHDAQKHRLPTAVLAVVPGSEVLARSVLDLLQGQHRALDQSYVVDADGGSVLYLLMPLTDQHGVDGFLTRVDGQLREHYGVSLSEAATVHQVVLRGPSAHRRQVAELFERTAAHAN